MLPKKTSWTRSSQGATETSTALWQELKNYLEAKREEIRNDIKHYPPPIPACDQQFNYLLEQRTRIHQDLRRVNAMLKESLTDAETVKAMEEFLQSATYLEESVKDLIRTYLNDYNQEVGMAVHSGGEGVSPVDVLSEQP
jgi:DNA-binding SARP family transcriptional activator